MHVFISERDEALKEMIMNTKLLMNMATVTSVLFLLACAPWCVYSHEELLVPITLVRKAPSHGAFCLDGTPPAYHLHRGSGHGANNWILFFEGGGWCGDLESCMVRAKTGFGSTNHMNKWSTFSGILSNNASLNPDFYNWNRVKLRYCDGASFAGDGKFDNGTSLLYFRGQKIWEAIVLDLLPQGLENADKALLAGCSDGALATFLHCDNFTRMLPNASVKCLSDAGFFLDVRDISLNHTIRWMFEGIVSLQGVEQNLDRDCTKTTDRPKLCFFPQNALKYIKTPFFVLNSAYDTVQFHHILAPPSADLEGKWNHCKHDPAACNADEIAILQGFRRDMLKALGSFLRDSKSGGAFINSCFAHCQSSAQDSWFAAGSPRIHNKTIAEAVGDWYFSRREKKEIDCEYPCDSTCHNLIPSPLVSEVPQVQQCATCGSVGNKTLTSKAGFHDRNWFKYTLILLFWLLS